MAYETPATQMFLLSPDSSSPGPGQIDTGYRMALSNDRPLASSPENASLLAQSQFEQSVSARVGLNDRVSIMGQAIWNSTRTATPDPDDTVDTNSSSPNFGGALEVTVRLFSPETLGGWDLRWSGGYRTALGVGYGRTRLEGSHALGDHWNLTMEGVLNHTFQSGRDTADLGAGLGINRILDPNWTAGLEYSGQDLESTVGFGDAEGGAQHLVGPTVAWHSLVEPLRALVGPGVLIQPHTPVQAVARALVGYEF